MNTFSLSVPALIPVVLLCWYIYAHDRAEKEPFWLLAILFAAGAAVYLPVILCENALIGLADKLFAASMEFNLGGFATFSSRAAHAGHSALCGFVAIALVEETAKWLLLTLITFKNKHFSHLFDGMIYAVFLSLGFAAVENVRYAVMDGWETFLLRSVTSVPAHMTFGVIMGICYTMWHTYLLARRQEQVLAAEGQITVKCPFRALPWLIAALAVPTVAHGIYSFLRFFRSELITTVFYLLLGGLFVVCFLVVRRISLADGEDDLIADRILRKKYPKEG